MSKVTVYVWLPPKWESVSSWFASGNAGHAAIDIEGFVYISFYPQKDFPLFKLLEKPSGTRYRSYLEEEKEMGSAKAFEIEGLDTQKMYNSWKAEEDKKYSLFWENCSGVVWKLLDKGMDEETRQKFLSYTRQYILDMTDSDFKNKMALAGERRRSFASISIYFAIFLIQPSDVYIIATLMSAFYKENSEIARLPEPQGVSAFLEQISVYFDLSNWEIVIEETGRQISEQFRQTTESIRNIIQQAIKLIGIITYWTFAITGIGLFIGSILLLTFFSIKGIANALL